MGVSTQSTWGQYRLDFLKMQFFVLLSVVSAAIAVPAPQESPVALPYVHEDIVAEPYVHEDIAAEAYVHEDPVETAAIAAEAYVHEDIVSEPYVHADIAAEPYAHEEPVETAEIAAEAYVHEEIEAEPYVHMEPVAAPVTYAAAPVAYAGYPYAAYPYHAAPVSAAAPVAAAHIAYPYAAPYAYAAFHTGCVNSLDLLSLAHKPKTSMQDLYISTKTKDYNYQKNCQQQNRIRRPKTASLIVYFRRSEAQYLLLSNSQFVKKTLV